MGFSLVVVVLAVPAFAVPLLLRQVDRTWHVAGPGRFVAAFWAAVAWRCAVLLGAAALFGAGIVWFLTTTASSERLDPGKNLVIGVAVAALGSGPLGVLQVTVAGWRRAVARRRTEGLALPATGGRAVRAGAVLPWIPLAVAGVGAFVATEAYLVLVGVLAGFVGVQEDGRTLETSAVVGVCYLMPAVAVAAGHLAVAVRLRRRSRRDRPGGEPVAPGPAEGEAAG